MIDQEEKFNRPREEYLLIDAIQDEDFEKVQKLLQAGVNPNILDENDDPCICSAIRDRNLKIVNALLEKGADPNTIDHRGDPLILYAIRSKDLNILNKLLEKGADPNAIDKDGNPMLLKTSNEKIIRALLNKGANPNHIDKNGNSTLNILLERKGDINTNIISLLIEHDKEKALNTRNSNGETLLHLAAQQGKTEIFDKYLDYCPTVNITDKAGYTPLYWSKLLNHKEISDMLIKRSEEMKEVAYTKTSKKASFENLPPQPKIAISYNSGVGGITSDAVMNNFKHQYCSVADIDYRKIVPESANAEKKINEEIIREAKQKATEFLADKDALVIPGNNVAVNPEVVQKFGGEVNLKRNESDFARSLAEMAMVEVAIEKGMPIMGICGGHQVINAYLKGKITDINNGHDYDSIVIEPNSELSSIIKKSSPLKDLANQEVWASHTNKVEEIGGKNRLIDHKDLLKVTATTVQGDIEATESQFGAPIRTFQFHPEMSKTTYSNAEITRDKKIFASFVQSAETFMNKKNLGVEIKSKVPMKKSFIEKISEQRKNQNTQRSI